MYPETDPLVENALKSIKPATNPYRAGVVVNTPTAQKFQVPISTEGFQTGTIQEFAPNNETLGENYSKTFWKALNTFNKFGASTLAAIPNFIDNQLFDGNDRIFKAVNQPFDTNAERYASPLDLKDQDRSITEWLTPTFLGGPAHTAYGDLVDQLALIGGTVAGTVATGNILGGISKLAGGLDVASGLNLGNKVKNAVVNLTNPNVLAKAATIGETLTFSNQIQGATNIQRIASSLGRMGQAIGFDAANSYTEALMEGLDGENHFIETQKEIYREQYGRELEGKALEEVLTQAKDLKNSRFGLNMAGLMISNIPFTMAFGGVKAFGIPGRLNKFGKTINAVGDVVDDTIPWLSKSSPLLQKTANYASKISLAPTEAAEELYQLAVEKGTDNYFSNKLNPDNLLSSYENFKESAQIGGAGIFTKEGLQSAILGTMVGGGLSTIRNIKDGKDFNKYLDTETPILNGDGTTGSITPRQSIKKDIAGIDLEVEKLFNPSVDPKSVALNQTLEDRVTQFTASANNTITLANTTGQYLERAVEQQAKFDEIFPYVKKGYKDLLLNKIETKFNELSQSIPETDTEQRSELSRRKQEAISDINTIDKYTRDIDTQYETTIDNPRDQAVYNYVKDLGVYHKWNLDQVVKEQDDIKSMFGTQFQTDPYLSKLKDDLSNVGTLIDKEIKELESTAIDGELVDSVKERIKTLKRIKKSKTKNDDYFNFRTNNTNPGYKIEDIPKIRQTQQKLKERLDNNVAILGTLSTIKNNPIRANQFLRGYVKQAEEISTEQTTVLDQKEKADKRLKDLETVRDNNNDLTSQEFEELKERFKDFSIPLTNKDIQEFLTNVRQKRKTEKLIVPTVGDFYKIGEDTYEVMIVREKDVTLENIETNDNLLMSLKDFNDKLKNKSLVKYKTEENGIDKTIKEKKADIERRRQEELKPYNERDAKSLEAITPNNPNHPTFKVGMKKNNGDNVIVEKTNTDNWNGEGEGYTIITAVKSPAEFDSNGKMTKAAKIEESVFNSKEEAEAAIQATFEKVKSKVGQKQKNINAKYDAELKALGGKSNKPIRTINPKVETESLIESKVIASIEVKEEIPEPTKENTKIVKFNYSENTGNHLEYDMGLIRTQRHGGNTHVFRIEVDGKEAVQINNNQEGLLIDLDMVKQFIDEGVQDGLENLENYTTLKGTVPFVEFLRLLQSLPEESGEKWFNFLQSKPFTLKKDVDNSDKIIEKGSSSYLFRFPKETLSSFIKRLEVENTMYQELTKDETLLDKGLDYLEKYVSLVKEFGIPKTELERVQKDSSSAFDYSVGNSYFNNSVINIERNTDGTFDIKKSYDSFLEDNNLSSDEIKDLSEKLNDFVKAEPTYRGYYVIANNKNNIFLTSIRYSLPFEAVENSNNFKLIGYIKNKDYNWKVDKSGVNDSGENIYSVTNTSTVQSQKNVGNQIDITLAKLKELIDAGEYGTDNTYIDPGTEKYSTIQEYARIQYKESFTKIKAVLNKEERKPKKIKPITPKPDLNLLEDNTSFIYGFEFKGDNYEIKKENEFQGQVYTLKEGVTEKQVKDLITSLTVTKGMKPVRLLKEVFNSGLFESKPASYSTISEYQLQKIKEFTETCL